MARMMPAILPREIPNRAERYVYEELSRQLPPDWVVRFHYTTCWREGSYLRDHEGDFIVIAPGKGLLFIEVKGSTGYESRDGKWFRLSDDGRSEECRNPFEQVTAFAHGVVENLSKQLGLEKAAFPGIYGHVVIYPNAKVAGPLPASQDVDAMIIGPQMAQLGQRITSLFAKWGHPARGSSFAGDSLKRVISFFGDDCKFVPVITRDEEVNGKVIETLTQRQWRAFRGILGNRRVKVMGGAGSGKTLLACWSAGRRSFDGEKVLLLCYNKCLSEWIRLSHNPEGDFEVANYHSWIAALCSKAGRSDAIGKAGESWDTQALDVACNVLDSVPFDQRYDTIVVDEAQDFRPEWWLPIQMALKSPDDGGMVIFMDTDQAGMYKNFIELPDGLIEFKLEENCRNGVRIADYAGSAIKREIKTVDGAPEGRVSVETRVASTSFEKGKILRADLLALLDSGVKPSDIAVLSPWSRDNPRCSFAKSDSIHGRQLNGGVENISAWRRGDVIWCSTIKSFKGMEASHILLCDVPDPGSQGFDAADLYVGITRARLGLKITAESQSALDYMRSLLRNQK